MKEKKLITIEEVKKEVEDARHSSDLRSPLRETHVDRGHRVKRKKTLSETEGDSDQTHPPDEEIDEKE